MSNRLEAAADLLLEKYYGDLYKLRESAERDPEQERKLLKEFKVSLQQFPRDKLTYACKRLCILIC